MLSTGDIPLTHIDGTPIFQTPQDRANEQQFATVLETSWGCELRHFGPLCAIDWYASRYGRVVGLLELRCRTHASGEYPTVFLSCQKWLALSFAANAFGCPALYVVGFTDDIRFVSIEKVDARHPMVRGNAREPHRFEPMIEVPIELMAKLHAL